MELAAGSQEPGPWLRRPAGVNSSFLCSSHGHCPGGCPLERAWATGGGLGGPIQPPQGDTVFSFSVWLLRGATPLGGMGQWVGRPVRCPLQNMNCPRIGRVQSSEIGVGDSGCRWRVGSQGLKPSLWKIKKRNEARELVWSDLFLRLSPPPSHGEAWVHVPVRPGWGGWFCLLYKSPFVCPVGEGLQQHHGETAAPTARPGHLPPQGAQI